jgi:murein DD-endopeptidase MepM/ murein hydrolase activator NlpD
MAYGSLVRGGGSLTQGYGCTPFGRACGCEWDCPSRCSSRFGFHAGIDIAASYGAVLLALGYGRVIQIGRLGGACGGLGPYAVGILTGGLMIWYGHASAALVRAGDLVAPGMAIARMGSLGCSTGTHLHYEVLPAGASSGCLSVDPAPYLASWPGAAPPVPVPAPLPAPPAPAPDPMPWAALAAAGLLIAYSTRG